MKMIMEMMKMIMMKMKIMIDNKNKIYYNMHY